MCLRNLQKNIGSFLKIFRNTAISLMIILVNLLQAIHVRRAGLPVVLLSLLPFPYAHAFSIGAARFPFRHYTVPEMKCSLSISTKSGVSTCVYQITEKHTLVNPPKNSDVVELQQ